MSQLTKACEMDVNNLTMHEWETCGPLDDPRLRNRFLEKSDGSADLATRLAQRGMLRVVEVRSGLQLTSSSFVGRVRLGDLNVTILPKIKGSELLRLLRYAYGLRNLQLETDVFHELDNCGLDDLLIHQLCVEASELISRGLCRAYRPREERLATLRGRIDIGRLVLDGGQLQTTLPCRHYERTENTLLNQVLLSGLRLAGSIAHDLELCRQTRRLAQLLAENVSPRRLSPQLIDRAFHQLTRLTQVYAPAISLIRLLMECQGVMLGPSHSSPRLSGFFFDMNAFFQAMLARFLRENLPGYEVRHEQGLRGMLRYNRQFNPRRQQPPTPRPDFVVMQKGQVCAILDAKYRDLWQTSLPRSMLYQLVIYAISQSRRPQSVILYPTMSPQAAEARIDVADPVYGHHLGQVCLRPVLIPMVLELIGVDTATGRRAREALARTWAFTN